MSSARKLVRGLCAVVAIPPTNRGCYHLPAPLSLLSHPFQNPQSNPQNTAAKIALFGKGWPTQINYTASHLGGCRWLLVLGWGQVLGTHCLRSCIASSI